MASGHSEDDDLSVTLEELVHSFIQETDGDVESFEINLRTIFSHFIDRNRVDQLQRGFTLVESHGALFPTLSEVLQGSSSTYLLRYSLHQQCVSADTVKELLKLVNLVQLEVDQLLTTVFNSNRSPGDKIYMVRLLKSAGVKLNAVDINGYSALHTYMSDFDIDISAEDFEEVVDMLLDSGVDINQTEENGNTALHLMFKRTYGSEVASVEEQALYTEVIKSFVERGADTNILNNYGSTLLHMAAETMMSNVCRYLMQAGVDSSRNSFGGGSPVFGLLVAGSIVKGVTVQLISEMITTLCDEGNIDINMPGIDGSLVIRQAVQTGTLELIKLFIAKGSSLHAKDLNGNGILHYLTKSHAEELDYLLGLLQEDINDKNHIGLTPLHVACAQGRYFIVERLLKHGADPMVTGPRGVTCLHLTTCATIFHGSQLGDIGDFLKAGFHEEKLEAYDLDQKWEDSSSHAMSESGSQEGHSHCKELVALLLAAGLLVDETDEGGATALHYAAFKGNKYFIRLLLEHGADVEKKDRHGWTPKDMMTIGGHHSLSSMLLLPSVENTLTPGLTSANFTHNIEKIGEYTEMVKTEFKRHGWLKLGDVSFLKEFGLAHVDESAPSVLYLRNKIELFLTDAIEAMATVDPLFKGRLIPSGSMYEGVKVGLPDELDYMVDLTEFSAAVERTESSDYSEFVRVLVTEEAAQGKLKPYITGRNKIDSIKVFLEYSRLFKRALLTAYNRHCDHILPCPGVLRLNAPGSSINVVDHHLLSEDIQWMSDEYKHMEISLDINPVLSFRSWPQHCATDSHLLDIATYGIKMIPKNIIPTEEPRADRTLWRLSFSHVETLMLHQLPTALKECFALIKALRMTPLSPVLWKHAKAMTWNEFTLFVRGGDAAAEEDSAQGEDNSTHGEDNSAPGEDDSTPTDDDSAPGEDDCAPTEDTSAPGEDASATNEHDIAQGEDDSVPGEDESSQLSTLPGWRSLHEAVDEDDKHLEVDEFYATESIKTFFVKQLFFHELDILYAAGTPTVDEKITVTISTPAAFKHVCMTVVEKLYTSIFPSAGHGNPCV